MSVWPELLQKARDPRFEEYTGDLLDEHFDRNYKFIVDIQRKEIQEIEKQLKKVRNPERVRATLYYFEGICPWFWIVSQEHISPHCCLCIIRWQREELRKAKSVLESKIATREQKQRARERKREAKKKEKVVWA